eukprot:UN00617
MKERSKVVLGKRQSVIERLIAPRDVFRRQKSRLPLTVEQISRVQALPG